MVLNQALRVAEGLVGEGERDAAAIEASIRAELGSAPLADVDYVAIVDAEDLRPVSTIAGECLIALAVRFGKTRLIDNTAVKVWRRG